MKPNIPITDKARPYVPAVATDIRRTFERFGFKAPSEQRKERSKQP